MPAKSKAQRQMMAIAEHHPEKLYKRNKGAAKMSKKQLHDYASTNEKGLPKKKNPNDHSKENARELRKMKGR